MYETSRTSGIFFVDSEGYLRGALKPSLHTSDDLTLSHVEVNMSNEEFDPARLPIKVLKHAVAMCPMGSVPGWATGVGATKIPSNIISGKAWDGGTLADTAEYVLYALPLGVSFSHGRAHVEGLASSQETQDLIESEYDTTFKEWVLGMVSIADNHATIQQVLHAIHQGQGIELKDFMGGAAVFGKLDLIGRQHFPFCQVTPMNQVAHADSLAARKNLCGPYKLLNAPTPAPALAAAAAPVTNASITDLVTALATKDDKREKEKLKLGLSRTNGVYIAGTADMTSGIITSLEMPVPTAGFVECCEKKTKEEKVVSFGQLANSCNKERPPGDTRCLYRDMELHDEVMLKNSVAGNYAQKVEDDLDKASGQVQFRNFWALDECSLVSMAEEKQKRDAEDAVGEIDANRGIKRSHIETAAFDMTLDGIRGAMANLLSIGEAKYVCTNPGATPLMVQFMKYMMDWTLEAPTVKWFKNKNNDIQKREMILCLHGIAESLMCGMASAAEEFTTASLLRKNTTVNMSKEDYETAFIAAAAEFDDLKKLRIRGKPVDYKSNYFSGRAVAAQKKQRAAGPAPTTKNVAGGRAQQVPGRAQQVPAQRPAPGAAKAQGETWIGSGWSEEAAGYAATKRSAPKFDAAVSKTKGSFLCKPTFDCALTPELSKKYCDKFLVFGKCCSPALGRCMKKHIPFYRFQAAEKVEQYEYILANKENVCINENDAPRDLPAKYAHLVRAPGQGAI